MSAFKQVLLGTFLVLAPLVAALGWWSWFPAGSWIVALLALFLLYLYVRAGLVFVSSRLTAAYAKESMTPGGVVSEQDLVKLQGYCTDPHSSISPAQIRYFTLSVISPATLRRRVIDEFTPQHRTVHRTVSVELDLSEELLPGEMKSSLVKMPDLPSGTAGQSGTAAEPAAPRIAVSDVLANGDGTDLYVALALPKKGVLYDQLKIVDDQGSAVHSLSHTESRILAAKVLRTFLISAYGGGTPPDPSCSHRWRRWLNRRLSRIS